MNIRWQKKLIVFVYHSLIFTLFVIGTNTENSLLTTIGIFDALTFRLFPIVRLFQRLLITKTACPNCQKEIELTANWKCSCGYVCQTPRSIFQSCRQCGKVFSFIKCDCDATILV